MGYPTPGLSDAGCPRSFFFTADLIRAEVLSLGDRDNSVGVGRGGVIQSNSDFFSWKAFRVSRGAVTNTHLTPAFSP